jgi:signal transduction histidine kinase
MEDQVLKSKMGPEPYGPIQLDIVFERDGLPRKYLSVDIVANKDKTGNIIGHIVVVSDITSRRMAEEEREQQRRVISLYASLLSHDIGNDLQAVLGYLEGTSMLLKEDAATAERMLKSAEAAGQRMANLVRTFRAESSPSHILVVEMLRQVAKVAETVSMGMTVHVEAEQSTTTLKSPGGTLLPIAFENLLRNAGQHAGRTPTVTIRTARENNRLVVTVADDGPGIPVEMRRFLFNRSDPKKETGLGLYLTKQIVTACGGTIELDPDGSGAAFKIDLPIVE